MSKFAVKLPTLMRRNIEWFLNVWHDGGVQIMPCAADGFPIRIEGKKAIRNLYGILLMEYKSMRIPDRVFYFTNDPNRIWVEFYCEIHIKVTGKSYKDTYACLFTLRDGEIVEYKEYFNPLILLSTFGGPETLQKRFGKLP